MKTTARSRRCWPRRAKERQRSCGRASVKGRRRLERTGGAERPASPTPATDWPSNVVAYWLLRSPRIRTRGQGSCGKRASRSPMGEAHLRHSGRAVMADGKADLRLRQRKRAVHRAPLDPAQRRKTALEDARAKPYKSGWSTAALWTHDGQGGVARARRVGAGSTPTGASTTQRDTGRYRAGPDEGRVTTADHRARGLGLFATRYKPKKNRPNALSLWSFEKGCWTGRHDLGGDGSISVGGGQEQTRGPGLQRPERRRARADHPLEMFQGASSRRPTDGQINGQGRRGRLEGWVNRGKAPARASSPASGGREGARRRVARHFPRGRARSGPSPLVANGARGTWS